MQVGWHDFDLTLDSPSARVAAEWRRLYAPFAGGQFRGARGPRIAIHLELQLAAVVPPPPAGRPAYHQPDLAVYPAGEGFVIQVPNRGQLRVEPAAGRAAGVLVPEVLDLYGAFEDFHALALAPLLRRHGRVLIHAFAAAYREQALLLVGEMASGKTTSGLALLAAGWKLIANDSPMLGERDGRLSAFAYPGLLSAGADALRRIPALAPLADDPALAPRRENWKICLAAEEIFDAPWQAAAPVKAICLTRLERGIGRREHRLEALSPAVALAHLLPHTVDRWDREMMDAHVDLMEALVRQAPAYRLDLGPAVARLPELLGGLLESA